MFRGEITGPRADTDEIWTTGDDAKPIREKNERTMEGLAAVKSKDRGYLFATSQRS